MSSARNTQKIILGHMTCNLNTGEQMYLPPELQGVILMFLKNCFVWKKLYHDCTAVFNSATSIRTNHLQHSERFVYATAIITQDNFVTTLNFSSSISIIKNSWFGFESSLEHNSCFDYYVRFFDDGETLKQCDHDH